MNKKVHIATLGCDKNTVDSEIIAGILMKEGYPLTNNMEEADVIIINTCSFIQDAKIESIDTIFDAIILKNNGYCNKIIVAGCLSQRYQEELLREIPEIDGIVGTGEIDKIPHIIENNEYKTCFDIIDNPYIEDVGRVLSTNSVTSYLKISEGCANHCTYCIIPELRGKYRSRPYKKIIEEAEYLYNQGIRELIIVAQDTTSYGIDNKDSFDLSDLMEEIAQKTNFTWIRLLYAYPDGINKKLLSVFQKYSQLIPYFDIPVQHTVDKILKKMGRKMTCALIENKIKLIKEMLPESVIRTSIITGFPGETETDYQKLLEDIQRLKFNHLGVFTYSQEEGTPAAEFADQISEEIKQRRKDEILEIQREISYRHNQAYVGKTMTVLIEETEDIDNKLFIGRSYKDAPEIDGIVYVNSPFVLQEGVFVEVEITDCLDYDLIGEIR
jgi:ribosomal protein S12 methylthiotransferase